MFPTLGDHFLPLSLSLGFCFLASHGHAEEWVLAGKAVRPGEIAEFSCTLTENGVKEAHADMEGNTAKARLGLPAQFDPAKPNPVLIISATSDGNASSVQDMNFYQQTAMDLGFVVLAADPPEKAKQDSHEVRWALIEAVLNAMQQTWPESKNWPYVCGGFSGGGKRTGFMAAKMADLGYSVMGMYMSGVNQDMATEGLKLYRPKAADFRKIPIFISCGKMDNVAPPARAEAVMDSMKKSGFKTVRMEMFEGNHMICDEHTRFALEWFLKERGQAEEVN